MPFGDHTLLLLEEGSLVAFGANAKGQLGLGHRNDRKEAAEVPWEGPRVVQVDWGCFHSLLLDEEGGVWETGLCRSSSPLVLFQRVPELPVITSVAAGCYHSAAVDEEGSLWLWTSKSSLSWACSTPQQVQSISALYKVACGYDFLVGEAFEGLWVLGDNSFGQLGLGHTNDVPQPTLLHGTFHSEGLLRGVAAFNHGILLIDSQGAAFTAGSNTYGQLGRSGDETTFQKIGSLPSLFIASCGSHHTLALDEMHRVWSWGLNWHGRLGNRGSLSHPSLLDCSEEVEAVLAGGKHSLVFQSDRRLLVFGANDSGQLGLSKTNQLRPTYSTLAQALPNQIARRQKSARF